MAGAREIAAKSKVWIALLLAVYVLALGWEAWRLGVTVDEPSSLIRAYTYWKRQDVLFPPDTTPLVWMVSGWVPRLLPPPLRGDVPGPKPLSSFSIGTEAMEAMSGAAAHRLIFLTRLTYVIFPLLVVWLVWRWGRDLFSERTALILAACTALEPTILGHGALLKSDVAGAFACVLFCYQAWRYWRQPGLRQVILLALALLVAVLAKFTLLVLVPAALALVLWRGPRWAGAVIVLGTFYVGLLAGYQFFQVQPIGAAELAQMRQQGFAGYEIAAARVVGRLPWPERFVSGIRHLSAADRHEQFPAYMLGRKIEQGAPLYFPLAWALKFPIALQLLTAAGLAALVARMARGETAAADAFVWLPPALLGALAMRSHIHMGFRHVTPALPFLILGGGFALERWGRRPAGWAATTAGLVWLAAASAWIYPQGIAYFNEWAGGPDNGWKYLADSNLDWGQNLPELARYVTENHVAKIKTFYFGFDVPEHYIPPEKIERQAAPWEDAYVKGPRLEPEPGVYAISVNMQLGYFFAPRYRDYFSCFRGRPPDARAGYSIFIYRVP